MMSIFGYFTEFFDPSNQVYNQVYNLVYNQVYGGIPTEDPFFKADGVPVYIRLRARVNYIY